MSHSSFAAVGIWQRAGLARRDLVVGRRRKPDAVRKTGEPGEACPARQAHQLIE